MTSFFLYTNVSQNSFSQHCLYTQFTNNMLWMQSFLVCSYRELNRNKRSSNLDIILGMDGIVINKFAWKVNVNVNEKPGNVK